jgi:PAS domain S-box-containing protein
MEQILEHIACGVFQIAVQEEKLLLLGANSAFSQMLAVDLADFGVGKELHEFLPQGFAQAIHANSVQCRSQKQPVTSTEWFEQGENLRAITVTLSPILNADGDVCQIVVTCQEMHRQSPLDKHWQIQAERFAHLIRENSDAVIVVDREGKVQYANKAAESLFYRPASELIGEIFGLPVVSGELTDVDIIRKGGETAAAEMRVIETKGEGEITYIVASLRDITARKQSEESLRLRERAIAASSNGIIITDTRQPNQPVIYVNPAFERITGYSADEVIGNNCRFLQGYDRDQPGLTELRKCLADRRECHVVVSNYRKNGSQFWNELYVSPVFNEYGELTNYVGIQNDITQRVKTETELRESEARLSTIFTTVKEGIVFSDEWGHFEVFNPEMENLTGYTMQEANASGDFTNLLFPNPGDRQMALERLKLLDRLGATCETETTIHTKSGELKNVLVATSLVSLKGRKMFLSAYHNITELKRNEEKLKRQSEREHLLSAITLEIGRELNLDKILATTVSEVRRLLHSDRVVLYQFKPDWTGYFIVESVEEGCEAVLGKTISDSYFTQEYLDKYRLGRTSTIDDILTANISECHRNLLAEYQIRANLVVPIAYSDKLWGLLLAHQCNEPRSWQQFEVDLLKQIANHVAIAIQQAELFQERQVLNTELQMLNVDLERQVAERTAQLEQQQLELQEYINAMATFNGRLTSDGKILTVNKIAQQSAGLPLERLLGMFFWDAPWWSYDSRVQKKVQEAVKQAAEGMAVSFEERAKVGESEMIIANLGLVPVFDEHGKVKYLIAESHDITDIRHAEEVLRQSLEKEKELGELKSRFVSIASHEFRTPLATIQAASDLLKHYSHKMTEQKRLERLNKIQAEVRNMTSLLEEVLIIGKVEAGKLELHPTPVDLREFCTGIIDDVYYSLGTKHQIDFTYEGSYYDAIVDTKLLRQIIDNLISNAIKYSPQGSNISLNLVYQSDRITIEVIDRGIGIPEEDLDQIFDSFYRSRNVGNISGTGLGLTIAKASVDLHGGSLTVESEISVGSTFTVTIPTNMKNVQAT